MRSSVLELERWQRPSHLTSCSPSSGTSFLCLLGTACQKTLVDACEAQMPSQTPRMCWQTLAHETPDNNQSGEARDVQPCLKNVEASIALFSCTVLHADAPSRGLGPTVLQQLAWEQIARQRNKPTDFLDGPQPEAFCELLWGEDVLLTGPGAYRQTAGR